MYAQQTCGVDVLVGNTPLVRGDYSSGRAHSNDVLLRSVPDRSRVEIGNLVEEHLRRLLVHSALGFPKARGVVPCVGATVLCLHGFGGFSAARDCQGLSRDGEGSGRFFGFFFRHMVS